MTGERGTWLSGARGPGPPRRTNSSSRSTGRYAPNARLGAALGPPLVEGQLRPRSVLAHGARQPAPQAPGRVGDALIDVLEEVDQVRAVRGATLASALHARRSAIMPFQNHRPPPTRSASRAPRPRPRT